MCQSSKTQMIAVAACAVQLPAPAKVPGCPSVFLGTYASTVSLALPAPPWIASSHRLSRKLGFVQGVGARAPAKPAAALCGWMIFPRLLNCACAIWSMQTALSSLQPRFVEIVVYLRCQLSHDTIWFISLRNQRKPEPDSQLVKINMTKVK